MRAPIALGLILDISLRQFDGNSIIDTVKKEICQVLKTFDHDDTLYLYDPLEVYTHTARGTQIGLIANYKSNGVKFDLELPFKQTLYVIANEDCDFDRIILYITDKFVKSDQSKINKVNRLNERDDVNCRFILCGLTDRYCKSLLDLSCDNVDCFHLDDPRNLKEELLRRLFNEDDTRDTTSRES